MSWTIGARDKRAISPLLYHPDHPSQLWCLSDVSAEQIIEADAIRRNAARHGVDVLWAGVFEGVLERLTEAEAETLSIRHPPISRAVAAAARRLGITNLRSFQRLQQGHSIELEVALLPEFRVPVGRRLRELLQKSRTRE